MRVSTNIAGQQARSDDVCTGWVGPSCALLPTSSWGRWGQCTSSVRNPCVEVGAEQATRGPYSSSVTQFNANACVRCDCTLPDSSSSHHVREPRHGACQCARGPRGLSGEKHRRFARREMDAPRARVARTPLFLFCPSESRRRRIVFPRVLEFVATLPSSAPRRSEASHAAGSWMRLHGCNGACRNPC